MLPRLNQILAQHFIPFFPFLDRCGLPSVSKQKKNRKVDLKQHLENQPYCTKVELAVGSYWEVALEEIYLKHAPNISSKKQMHLCTNLISLSIVGAH